MSRLELVWSEGPEFFAADSAAMLAASKDRAREAREWEAHVWDVLEVAGTPEGQVMAAARRRHPGRRAR